MITSTIAKQSKNAYPVFFYLFLFFSAIFCMSTRANNLFHITLALFVLSLLSRQNLSMLVQNCRGKGLILFAMIVFMIYFSLSNFWGSEPPRFNSTLTHGTYLFFYVLILNTLLENPRSRHFAMLSVVAGITVLSVYTLITDYSLVLTLRQVSLSNPGPTNVIDLAGYCGVGILISAMLMKEQKQPLYWIPIVILLFMMLLTQSRGPIISLFIAFLFTLHLKLLTGRNLAIGAVLIIVFAALFFFTPAGDLLVGRFEALSTQSGLRLSIWHHTLQEVSSHWWLGRGFTFDLDFINYSGEHITTTHSVYLGTLLKGGIVGFFTLMMIIFCGLAFAIGKYVKDKRYETALFIFALIFMSSQGMFIISNPRESWILFWLPLAVVISHSKPKNLFYTF
ncbi:O-antigen ligase family protein [Phytobacter sp. RSE-02]|jgi:O-antigen ligase|uniref:O-antigen ligase family protein n=1 Tax=Phytobacter sp. RSE-02 TaxID=3229229 RepID=UPI00339D4A70